MKKSDVIQYILGERFGEHPQQETVHAFAPTNIALCKYWGKRDQELNLPVTSSLSISLGDKGAAVTLSVISSDQDDVLLNNAEVSVDTSFYKRLVNFLNLFRQDQTKFKLEITSNIPIAAGLASSACGFASLVSALNKLYAWNLSESELSILARLGSGSASRSLWQGFVEWQKGERVDGMDSHGFSLASSWPEFCIGLVIVNNQEKIISSREAMQRTVATSALYSSWPDKVANDLAKIKVSIAKKDFKLLGETAESNAMTMHATMLSAWPAVTYAQAETIAAMQKVWELRAEGLPVYFTQDAGPNIKLLFEKNHLEIIKNHFKQIEIIQPFESSLSS